MSWIDMPIAAFDLETSGTDVFTDRIVTACVALINGTNVVVRNWIADPGVEIPQEATDVHGVTTEYAREHGRPHSDVVEEIVAALYDAWGSGFQVAAYNANFDMSMLAAHKSTFEVRGLIIDPLVLDKELDQFRKGSRKLSDVCAHYGVTMGEAHTAEGDALAAARLAWIMPRKFYPALQLMSVDRLMASQSEWYKSRAYSFIDYLRRQNKPYDTVATEWPIRTQHQHAA